MGELAGIRRADLFKRGDWWDDSITGVKTWGNEDKHGNYHRARCEIEIEDQKLPRRHRRYHICAGPMPGIKVRWPDGDFAQYYLKDPRNPTKWFDTELVPAEVSFTLSGDPCPDSGGESYQRRRRSVRAGQ